MSVIFPFIIISEPECGVEEKETKSVSVMERERLEGTAMNVVNEYTHTLKLNINDVIALL